MAKRKQLKVPPLHIETPGTGYRIHSVFNTFLVTDLEDFVQIDFALLKADTLLSRDTMIGSRLRVKSFCEGLDDYLARIDGQELDPPRTFPQIQSTAPAKPWSFNFIRCGQVAGTANTADLGFFGAAEFSIHDRIQEQLKSNPSETAIAHADPIALMRASPNVHFHLLFELVQRYKES